MQSHSYFKRIYPRFLPERIQGQPHQNGFSKKSTSRVTSQICEIIRQKAKTISTSEFSTYLDELYDHLEHIQDNKQRLINLEEISSVLIRVQRSILLSVCQHQFFSLLQNALREILQQWTATSNFNKNQLFLFRNIAILYKKQFKDIKNIDDFPSWLIDSSILKMVAMSITIIGKSTKEDNERIMKNFDRFFDIYKYYQISIYENSAANQDQLEQLVDPIVECLSSDFYLNAFRNLKNDDKKISAQEKFFLFDFPVFFMAYNGSRREESTEQLLSTMLPKYIQLFNTLMPSVNQWKDQLIRAVDYLLRLVNHKSKTSKCLSSHLPFVDHVLKIIDTPRFYTKLQNSLSNPETRLIDTAISLLEHSISDSTVVTHIKQEKVTSSFMRYTSAKYEPIAYNTYTLLAYTTNEDDIKSMENPGHLLSTVFNAFRNSVENKSNDTQEITQLLGTLKGLVQHDQLKEEVLKQNMLSFLLDSTNKLTATPLALLLETLWTLAFFPKLATVLRDNVQIQEKVQELLKTTENEAVKKAAEGLVWKLIREPEFLNKVAQRQEEEDKDPEATTVTTTKVIVGADGKEQVVTTTKPAEQAEKIFPYDIMISYCHADKDLVKRIHKFLISQGFKIWIDLDNMFGPAMSAMAEAVESSEFVLLCMSESYKNSTYCQAEAEYAFGCKRRLVPLIVRPHYRADGWLGFLIGTRIYINYGTLDFDIACGKLMDEISRQRKRPFPAKAVPKTTDSNQPTISEEKSQEKSSSKFLDQYTKRQPNSNFNTQHMYQWTDSDVLDFLFMNKLHEFMPLCEKMDGPALIQLYKMCIAHSNRTYNILNDQLQSQHKIFLPIGTYTTFLSIMERKIILPPKTPMYQPVLPPPTLPSLTTQGSDGAYDIVVTSNAPVFKLLNMLENVGSCWQLKGSQY